MLPIKQIAFIFNVDIGVRSNNTVIKYLSIDTRQIIDAPHSLFFALTTTARNGHIFINNAYQKGIKYFVVSDELDYTIYPNALFLKVAHVKNALQHLVAVYRSSFNIPIIGITGSNGKTIVKEWLSNICKLHINVAKSPQSFNSQIGVPLSVWQLNKTTEVGIFEAGISTVNEMEFLEKIIAPTIGVFTHLGNAHINGFKNATEILSEKWLLFKHCNAIICEDLAIYHNATFINKALLKTWGANGNFVKIINTKINNISTKVALVCNNQTYNFTLPFTQSILVTNAMHVITTALYLNIPINKIVKGIADLTPLNMRLSITDGINNCKIINDAYTNDVEAIRAAIEVLKQYHSKNAIVIISDLEYANSEVYQTVFKLICTANLKNLITIGAGWAGYLEAIKNPPFLHFSFLNTPQFLGANMLNSFTNATVLIKGARKFMFENIVAQLQHKTHQTWVNINLIHLTENLHTLRSCLPNNVAIMAMVKASSYGSGVLEIATHLAQNNINYLAVAYADEGILLRDKGITLPIMVMNPEPNQWQKFISYNLEPEVYSLTLLQHIVNYCEANEVALLPIHIKLDTGMHRLGFLAHEIDDLILLLKTYSFLKIKSVFTHLAAADNEMHDDFTKQQLEQFETQIKKIKATVNYFFYIHAANSAAVIRFGIMGCNMVRLGIGMYGINPTAIGNLALKPVLTFYTTIAQIKQIPAGSTVGYGLSFTALKPTTIAIVRVGYADGYPRNLSNGIGYMIVNNKKAFVCGKVCMDMVMIDITEIEAVKVGDICTIIGEGITAAILANLANTIPYEIITGISNRVQRLYIQ